ncbi:hypothetical protein Lal_00001716 [Lupinus albus]|nr:hypothetical protein Lal_00001716 [Lupinus albus]
MAILRGAEFGFFGVLVERRGPTPSFSLGRFNSSTVRKKAPPVNELNSQRNQNLNEIDSVSLSDGEEVRRKGVEDIKSEGTEARNRKGEILIEKPRHFSSGFVPVACHGSFVHPSFPMSFLVGKPNWRFTTKKSFFLF